MKISREWLQTYFDAPLPSAQDLSHALTFHAFEIDGIERHQDDDVLDVKVTPNRGHDCLSHRGIAKELSAILNIPLKVDPLRVRFPESQGPEIQFSITDTFRAPVAAAAYVRGVTIGSSPEWLRKRLEAVGQRSINNVVDATNYVMFDIGMPTHAFDAESFKHSGAVHYGIRASKKDEQLVLLKGESVVLTGNEAVIMNAKGEAVDIGGVKGGALAELHNETKELMLSASKFHPVETRRAAQRFNQRTEAAKRFENEMADDLAVYGIHILARMIVDVAGGEVVSVGVKRVSPAEKKTVTVSQSLINARLGIIVPSTAVEDVWKRLGFEFETKGEEYVVSVPFERLDLIIPEDLVEEVGRIVGYDSVPETELPSLGTSVEINQNFAAAEKVRAELTADGYSEIFTSVFVEKGKRAVSNKIGGDKPFLRANLTDGLAEALKKNIQSKDLLGLKEIKLFEIGTAWLKDKEVMMVGIVTEKTKATEKPLSEYVTAAVAYETLPISQTERFQQFSRYPYIVRDIAFWTPDGIYPEIVIEMIKKHAGSLLVRIDQFDRFEKDGRLSYAFRLVFQSFDQTLTDLDANERMESVYTSLRAQGFEIR